MTEQPRDATQTSELRFPLSAACGVVVQFSGPVTQECIACFREYLALMLTAYPPATQLAVRAKEVESGG